MSREDRTWSDPEVGDGSGADRAELRGAAAGVVAGLGVFFLVRHLSTAPGGLYDLPFLLLSIAVCYAGYWLLRSDFCHRRVGRVALWSLAGFLALVAIAVWLSGGRAVAVGGSAGLIVDVGTVGASSGLLAGLCGERRRRSDREALAAVERAEERLEFFNRLLRHHLLNGVAVVRGHAELLSEGHDDPPEAIEIIRRRSDELVDVVRNVETLSRAFAGDLPVYAVDPAPPLRAAVEAIRADGAEVDLRGDLRDVGRVRANGRLGMVFETLLRWGLTIAEDGRVAVETAAREDEFVTSVAVSGPIDDRDGAVEVGDHGDGDLGLYIAETLAEYFGGSLEVVATDAGAVLTIRLRRVD